eukprot:scaffold23483_cov58-Phaeocystis_antarctica.AAC.2
MFLTLEVSKLSGWLNADAYCRESKERHAMRGEVQTGRLEVAADRGARSVQERARLQIGRRARGGAHVEQVAHVRDAGGVEAQRLVERRRCLPRVEITTCDAGRGADRQAGGGGRPRARGGAHPEHVAHVRDAGGVEAQRLVERRRVLPRVERRACDAGQGAGWEAGGGGRPRCTQRAGEGSTADSGQVTGGAHVEHLVHGCDAGGVPVGYIRVEPQTIVIDTIVIDTVTVSFVIYLEEPAHVGDGRDVPVGDGAVRRNGGLLVGIVLLGRRP